MDENEVARVVVDAAYQIHAHFGAALLESVYQKALAHELSKRGLSVETEVPIQATYDGIDLGEAFRADLLVEKKVIIELKSISEITPVHTKQLLTYLRLADKRLGLLINFGDPYFKRAVTRIVNGLKD